MPGSRTSCSNIRPWGLSLPENIRVEARHDLVGIRLAQVALGFGADTLAGPIAPPRVLPLAGVSRPDENTVAALSLLVTEAGLTPELFDPDSEGVPFEILDGGTQPLETDAEES